jgi:tetratricopeptide (TPR) repeat protein
LTGILLKKYSGQARMTQHGFFMWLIQTMLEKFKMDRLDRFSIWAIVILIISSSALISHHVGESKPSQDSQQKMLALSNTVAFTDMENKSIEIKSLIEGNNLNKAEILVKELIQKYPFEGEPRMLMGDIFMRRQDSINAALEYKEAVDLNPDYLDKKTPLFQGKKLNVAVKEAIIEIEKKIKADPDDKLIKKYRKDIYYLQRKLAGGCA